MISLTIKGSSLKALATSFLKSGASGSFICTGSRRTLFTNDVLLLRNIYKKNTYDVNSQLSGDQKCLGKVIELANDFNDVRIDETEEKGRKMKKKVVKCSEMLKRNDGLISGEQKKDRSESCKDSYKELRDFKRNSTLFKSIMTKLKLKKGREKHNQIILEGTRLIQSAISAGFEPVKIFGSAKEKLQQLSLPENTRVYKIPYKTLQLWSDVVKSQGVIGIFNMPSMTTSRDNANSLPLTIVCDNVRDPSNLGSILRVVAAAGCKKVMLTKGCVDVWEPKVLRSSAGAHFQFPVINNLLWSDVEQEINESSRVIIADLNDSDLLSQTSGNEDLSESNFYAFRKLSNVSGSLPTHCYYSLKYGDENTVLIIGGETHGISEEAYKFTLERNGSKVFIPLSNQIESLNNAVALGILIYEFRRQYDLRNREEHSLRATSCET